MKNGNALLSAFINLLLEASREERTQSMNLSPWNLFTENGFRKVEGRYDANIWKQGGHELGKRYPENLLRPYKGSYFILSDGIGIGLGRQQRLYEADLIWNSIMLPRLELLTKEKLLGLHIPTNDDQCGLYDASHVEKQSRKWKQLKKEPAAAIWAAMFYHT
ncbi:hypothetical protein HAX54_051433 [Datura stramonium]|uniref:Uncharacterized protein n=1 Tax=Datura stramonium TaxID=4076 RepID=A0ABS8WQ98_DATST|nr:hypothetical protein [Datura stramonium]